MPLAGQRILVTGASSGIGAATACLLGKLGAIVGVHYNKNYEGAKATCTKIKDMGARAELFQADLINPDGRWLLIHGVIKTFGGLNALVNNAGGLSSPREFNTLSHQDWIEVFELNVFAPAHLCQYVFAYMKKQKGGRIVNISSIGVKYGGSPTSLHYAAAKSALETMTLGLAKAGARHNILVNAIRPGFIMTPMNQDMTREECDKRVAMIPLHRSGKPEDIAEMIAYLLSPAASFITGQIFTVSGGD